MSEFCYVRRPVSTVNNLPVKLLSKKLLKAGLEACLSSINYTNN